MGSKTPPLGRDVQRALDENLVDRPAASMESRHSALLGRIADALQVPQAALIRRPDAVTPACGADRDGAIDLAEECAALLRAFGRIDAPEERRRLLNLMQAAAERS